MADALTSTALERTCSVPPLEAGELITKKVAQKAPALLGLGGRLHLDPAGVEPMGRQMERVSQPTRAAKLTNTGQIAKPCSPDMRIWQA